MMTSSNGNIFRVTEFPPQRPMTQIFDVFFLSEPEQMAKQTDETLVIWDAITLIMTSQ